VYKVIEFNDEEEYINDFIKLAHNIYSKNEIMQNDLELKQILTNTHLFSKYYYLRRFLVYKENTVVSRAILTFYENDNNAYFGFFETMNDVTAVTLLFNHIFKVSNSYNKEKLIGPLNANFWIGYKLKINNFNESPYYGEPYNKEYYYDLLKKVGFLDYEKYYTNFYNKPDKNYINVKAKERYNKFMQENYELKTLGDFQDVKGAASNIHDLVMELYKDFPIFKSISKEDYIEYAKDMHLICDYKMQKFFYYNGKPVAFCVTFPNYNNLLLQDSLEAKLEVMKRREKSNEYIITYMGVRKNHAGLGLAMANEVIEDIKEKGGSPIAASIIKGKITANYVKNEIIKQNEYVLLYKNLI